MAAINGPDTLDYLISGFRNGRVGIQEDQLIHVSAKGRHSKEVITKRDVVFGKIHTFIQNHPIRQPQRTFKLYTAIEQRKARLKGRITGIRGLCVSNADRKKIENIIQEIDAIQKSILKRFGSYFEAHQIAKGLNGTNRVGFNKKESRFVCLKRGFFFGWKNLNANIEMQLDLITTKIESFISAEKDNLSEKEIQAIKKKLFNRAKRLEVRRERFFVSQSGKKTIDKIINKMKQLGTSVITLMQSAQVETPPPAEEVKTATPQLPPLNATTSPSLLPSMLRERPRAPARSRPSPPEAPPTAAPALPPPPPPPPSGLGGPAAIKIAQPPSDTFPLLENEPQPKIPTTNLKLLTNSKLEQLAAELKSAAKDLEPLLIPFEKDIEKLQAEQEKLAAREEELERAKTALARSQTTLDAINTGGEKVVINGTTFYTDDYVDTYNRKIDEAKRKNASNIPDKYPESRKYSNMKEPTMEAIRQYREEIAHLEGPDGEIAQIQATIEALENSQRETVPFSSFEALLEEKRDKIRFWNDAARKVHRVLNGKKKPKEPVARVKAASFHELNPELPPRSPAKPGGRLVSSIALQKPEGRTLFVRQGAEADDS